MASPAEFGSTREHFVDALGPHIIDGTSVSKNGNGGDGTDAGVGDAAAPGGQVMLFQGMSFYLNRDSSANDSLSDAAQLHQLIESHGGLILGEIPKGSTPQNTGNLFVVSPYNDTRLPTVTPTYIRACCQNNALLEIENYLVPFDEFRSVIDTQLQNEGKDQQAKIEQQEHQVQREQREQQEQRLLQEQEQIQRQRQRQGQEQEHGKPLVEVEDKPDRQGVVSPRQGSSDSGYDSTRSMLTRSNMPTHNKASFTEAEDEFILDVVRKNPTRRTTHTLYDEISHYVPNHTGNSIRHRFRVYLSKRLEFVYEVDKYGKLVRDENGSLVRTKVLPPSIKKKFTAGEDYQLATGIKKQFYRDLYQIDPDTGVSLITDEDSPTAIAKRNMTMDPNHVPGTEPSFQDYRVNDRRGPIAREFFKQFGESHPTHTENAWRDRFRKFLLSYGIDNYIHYYEREIGHGNDPEPMKNLTNRVKRPGIPTPGNYNSATKRARITGSESRSSQNSGSSVNSSSAAATAAAAAAAAAAATAAAAASQGNVPGSAAHLEAANAAAHYAIPESELLDEDTMNFISSLKNDLTKVDNSIPFEYPQEIAEAIRNDFSNEEARYDNIDPDSIPFPPEVASIDLFLPQFFRMSSTREFLGKVHEVISRDYEPSQAEKLVQDLCDEAGVRKTFSTSILTALSGDLMVFPRYFLNMFKYNTNPPANVPGIWTREDDRMLRSSKEDDLRALAKKHGSGRIEMRRKFVEKDLI
ncbi:RAP1 (YNL216W) [Zygosaccharomyces parabailii]|nr:RAP1 (YNL216W) [Zygosaccharomyces parabailii]